MSEPLLRIGVSACLLHPDPLRAFFKGKTLLYAEESMLRWIQSAGALPVLLPRPFGTIDARALARSVDGLVLQGGVDVSPAHYGEEPLRPEWSGDVLRDAYELALIRACLEEDRPLLGVCRGVQILNVALGGSLFQDVETLHPGARAHRRWEIYDRHGHDVAFEPESALRAWYGVTHARINSVHHQAVRTLGRDLVVEARSVPDGVIEAVRYVAPPDAPRRPFAFGVQWHPEFMQDTDPGNDTPVADGAPLPALATTPLLEGFLTEVGRRRSARGDGPPFSEYAAGAAATPR